MKNIFLITLLSIICNSVSFFDNNNGIVNNENSTENNNANIDDMENNKIKIKVNSQTFTATLLDNNTTKAFKKMLPMTISMTEMNRDEKYYNLSKSLPTHASNPGTTKKGDLMLFGSKTLVLFYKTRSTSYSYTKLGVVDDVTGLAEALGSGNVTVTFKIEK